MNEPPLIQNAVLTRAVTAATCGAMHHLMTIQQTSQTQILMEFWYFTSLHGGGEGSGDTGLYKIECFSTSTISISFSLSDMFTNRCATKSFFLRIPHKTLAELYENKRTDWFTRNSSCDRYLKFAPEAFVCRKQFSKRLSLTGRNDFVYHIQSVLKNKFVRIIM